jgi:hypothetical protein
VNAMKQKRKVNVIWFHLLFNICTLMTYTIVLVLDG